MLGYFCFFTIFSLDNLQRVEIGQIGKHVFG